MGKIRRRLTFANVVSCLALFVALGGGAYAATHLQKNSVGARQLKKNAVTTAKIKKAAVTAAKIKKNAVTRAKVRAGAIDGSKVADGSLTGADIDQTTLNDVRAANVMAISISEDASCSAALPLPTGVTVHRSDPGVCELLFPASISSCTATASVHLRLPALLAISSEDRTAFVTSYEPEPDRLTVFTYAKGSLENLPFDLVVVC